MHLLQIINFKWNLTELIFFALFIIKDIYLCLPNLVNITKCSIPLIIIPSNINSFNILLK